MSDRDQDFKLLVKNVTNQTFFDRLRSIWGEDAGPTAGDGIKWARYPLSDTAVFQFSRTFKVINSIFKAMVTKDLYLTKNTKLLQLHSSFQNTSKRKVFTFNYFTAA